MSKYGMIVIDKTAMDKMCIVYTTAVRGVDFVEAVENCFEDIGIEVDVEEVDRIADEVFHKGFANWDMLHFEMLMK